jgi:hypothetical protein
MKKYYLAALFMLFSYSRIALVCEPAVNNIFIGDCDTNKNTIVSVITEQEASYVSTTQKINNKTYINTPDLINDDTLVTSIKAIEDALKQGGLYRIFFIIILEEGKPRAKDLAIINSVMNSINTGGKKNFAVLLDDKLKKQAINQIDTGKYRASNIFYINTAASPKSLNELIEKNKGILIQSDQVSGIDIGSYKTTCLTDVNNIQNQRQITILTPEPSQPESLPKDQDDCSCPLV